MKRRQLDSGESLDLLLDTISNAFGGILFVTILFTILLRMSHAPSTTPPVTEAARLELIEVSHEFDSVLAELEALEQAVVLQAESRQRLASAELEAGFAKLELDRTARDAARSNLLQVAQAAAQEQKTLDDLARRNEELDGRLSLAEEAHLRAVAALFDEQRRRTQSVIPPHTRQTHKRECTLIVRYGKAYQQWRGHSILDREPNFEEFVVVEEDGVSRITPKPYSGLAIEEGADFRQSLAAKLRRHDAGNWYVCVGVWEDSFKEFALVKQALVDLGYEYRIIAVQPGGQIVETSGVNPQVQ